MAVDADSPTPNLEAEVSSRRCGVGRRFAAARLEGRGLAWWPWHGRSGAENQSGEDYLYPADFFVGIDLPKEAAPVFAAAQP